MEMQERDAKRRERICVCTRQAPSTKDKKKADEADDDDDDRPREKEPLRSSSRLTDSHSRMLLPEGGLMFCIISTFALGERERERESPVTRCGEEGQGIGSWALAPRKKEKRIDGDGSVIQG
ncbi:hypothetical protein B7463_g5673, partial [Scytalidium lignicola]